MVCSGDDGDASSLPFEGEKKILPLGCVDNMKNGCGGSDLPGLTLKTPKCSDCPSFQWISTTPGFKGLSSEDEQDGNVRTPLGGLSFI